MNQFVVASVRFLGRSAGMVLETNDDNLNDVVEDVTILDKVARIMGFDSLADYNLQYGLERLLGASLAAMLKISKNYNRPLVAMGISRHEDNVDGLKVTFDSIFGNRDAMTDPYILYPTLEDARRATYPKQWPYNGTYYSDKSTTKYRWFCSDWGGGWVE